MLSGGSWGGCVSEMIPGALGGGDLRAMKSSFGSLGPVKGSQPGRSLPEVAKHCSVCSFPSFCKSSGDTPPAKKRKSDHTTSQVKEKVKEVSTQVKLPTRATKRRRPSGSDDASSTESGKETFEPAAKRRRLSTLDEETLQAGLLLGQVQGSKEPPMTYLEAPKLGGDVYPCAPPMTSVKYIDVCCPEPQDIEMTSCSPPPEELQERAVEQAVAGKNNGAALDVEKKELPSLEKTVEGFIPLTEVP
ncbi:PREDICTED: uncharacterized protein LOC106890451 [Calidris pugnax]|uniref:uncharacterized protein LOC106890451 n=1 Tax=Calidris pugnax TaxID=198806 RepID=UPI00071CF264|nr:PREDICTED: uncharacterized protein LOC106890451 [Calidris pugnax]